LRKSTSSPAFSHIEEAADAHALSLKRFRSEERHCRGLEERDCGGLEIGHGGLEERHHGSRTAASS
jgi:hypothetical protein